MTPWDLTLHQLFSMARGRWDLVAVMWATLVNVNRGKDSLPAHPADIHPYRHRLDYDRQVKDADYHRERRLLLLPLDQRRAVIAKMEAEREQKEGD